MKTLKKLSAAFCAMLLVMSMSITAMADTYTIKISNTKANQTYTAYKMFDVESYADDDKAVYTIKTTDDFYAFVTGDGKGANYVTLTASETTDGTYYVTWKDGIDQTTAAEFAQYAVAYAEDNNITAAGMATSTEDNQELTISVDNAGYYVVDTSLGSLASLDTTNPTAEIKEKNGVPNVTKTVLEDSTNVYGYANTASIGDTVTFITKIEVAKTATDYVLYDLMDSGFTYNGDAKVYTDEDCTTALDLSLYNVTANSGTYESASVETATTASFNIVFDDGPLTGVTYDANDEGAIYVKYTATLNENAVSTYNTVTANYNKTYLTYGENGTATAEAYTKTYTYAFDLVKTDDSDTLLDGASFQLKDADGNAVKFTKVSDTEYRVDPSGSVDTIVVANGGAIKIVGLDADTYTLAETVTPNGYNRASDTTVTITGDDSTATVNSAALVATIDDTTYKEGGVRVVNKAGSLLPSTGGIGTTIFYIVGGCLVIGAIVFLVTRRRMSAEENAE